MHARSAFVALIVISLTTTAPVAAQSRGSGHWNSGTTNVDTLAAMFKLTPPQKAKAEQMATVMRAGMQPFIEYNRRMILSGAQISPDSARAERRIRATFDSGFRALLDTSQVRRYDSARATLPPIGRVTHRGAPPP